MTDGGNGPSVLGYAMRTLLSDRQVRVPELLTLRNISDTLTLGISPVHVATASDGRSSAM